jgi:hypothetical protein
VRRYSPLDQGVPERQTFFTRFFNGIGIFANIPAWVQCNKAFGLRKRIGQAGSLTTPACFAFVAMNRAKVDHL